MHRWLSILFVALGAFGLGACSGSGNPLGTGGAGGGAGGTPRLNCDEVQVPPPSCGDACNSDSDCALGAYCDGDCTFQCTDEVPCPGDMECNVRGRCIPIFAGTGGTGNAGGTNCQSVEVTPTRSIPNVMFLVDQSGSMDEELSGGSPEPGEPNRWEVARDAITTVVSELDAIVRFGLTTYTSDDGFNYPQSPARECPKLPTQIDFALSNSSTIDSAQYPMSYPTADGNDTPTGDSIDALVSEIQSSPPPNEGPTIIVLATDGLPDSCECPDGGHPGCSQTPTPDDARDEAVAAAGRSHDAGIDLFFLWVGPLSNQGVADHVQEVANVGVGLASDGSGGDATFWVGDNPQNLEDAFREIISDSVSCDIEIDKPFDDTDKACEEGDVQLNGVALSCPEDWRVKPTADNVMELLGDACETFKAEAATFTAEFPCGAIIVE
ncbi:MAG: vWA domain-containing protein [Myxococcota bacterium]